MEENNCIGLVESQRIGFKIQCIVENVGVKLIWKSYVE